MCPFVALIFAVVAVIGVNAGGADRKSHSLQRVRSEVPVRVVDVGVFGAVWFGGAFGVGVAATAVIRLLSETATCCVLHLPRIVHRGLLCANPRPTVSVCVNWATVSGLCRRFIFSAPFYSIVFPRSYVSLTCPLPPSPSYLSPVMTVLRNIKLFVRKRRLASLGAPSHRRRRCASRALTSWSTRTAAQT